jgi:hypothetical protein
MDNPKNYTPRAWKFRCAYKRAFAQFKLDHPKLAYGLGQVGLSGAHNHAWNIASAEVGLA